MADIEEIIKTIDDKLIETGKSYMLLGHANQLLKNEGVISISEKYDYTLKKLLQDNKIPHAYQTEKYPRQWRIPLSENGKQRKRKVKRKIIPKESITYVNRHQSQNKFENQLRVNQNSTFTDDLKITRTQRNWIIGIFVLLVLFIVGNLGKDDSSFTSNLYYVNTTTYAGTTKANFDEMFRYINDKDELALSSLMLSGQMKTLSTGTEVYLVSTHFSYCVVRQKSSTQNLWVVTSHITKK